MHGVQHLASVICCQHHYSSLGKFLSSQIKAVVRMVRQPSRLTSFLFFQLDGLGSVSDGVLGKANKLPVKLPLSNFFQVDNTWNDFILFSGFNTRKEGWIPYSFSSIHWPPLQYSELIWAANSLAFSRAKRSHSRRRCQENMGSAILGCGLIFDGWIC